MAATTDTFNKLANDYVEFWHTYARGRPSVPASFWQRLANYHTQHGNAHFSHVHDLGSGPGIHARALAENFDHVTLTDPSAANIEAATAVLSQRSDGERFSCRVGRGEDEVKSEDLGRYDMVFLGNSLHWMDLETSLINIASSLRDGGTFAAAMFGVPDVTDKTARDAILNWIQNGADLILAQDKSPSFPSTMIVQDSDYDSVGLDPLVWQNVTRIKLNRDGASHRNLVSEGFLQKFHGGHSAVTKSETILQEKDSDWYITTNLAGLREMIGSFPIPPMPAIEKNLWDTLNSTYDSRPVEVHYGVTIVMATKRPKA